MAAVPGGGALRRCSLPASGDLKYCCCGPCISHWTNAACHAFPELCCISPFEPTKHTYTSRTARPSAASGAATTMPSPVMSAVIAIFIALTLAQLPACAAARPGVTFVNSTHQRFRFSAVTSQDFSALGRNPRRIGGGFISPNMARGRKMMLGTLSCGPQDLSLTQGPLPSTGGIPTFDVQIVNLCGSCAMSQIHVACGNWASATPVNPYVFTRLSYNDCLVNNGAALSSQGSVSFQYANSAMYPMSITSASSKCPR